MFESVPPEPGALRHASDETVVAAIEDWNRLEAEVSARRLDAIAELTSRCCDKEGQRAEWACDGWDEVAGEVAAAMGVNPKKASSQMSLALDLRHRLPEVAALHRAGLVSARVVGAIAWRTRLVGDEALAKIDAALGERAQAWGELSEYKLSQSIDYWVNRHDPDARHRVRENARGRDFHIGRRDDESDTTGMWGRLHAADAAVLKRRLKDMAHSVCDDDPRTMRQRRADAMGALAAGATRLACLCGNPDCPPAGDDGRGSNTVIHVVTEAAALDAQPDPLMSGKGKQPASEPDPPCEKKATPPSGLLLRGGIVPAPLLAELIRCGATVSQVQHPGDAPESGYRPSARLEEFVRVRDMTCRFPGCEEPAEFCDIDHTIPWPVGLTHPSNLKCVCRKHHLLKTFWTGWADVQLPDGTVVWTSPQGKTYRTLPGSRIFFPAWDITTAALPPPTTDPIPATGVMMPKRRRTRTKNRAHHIQKERALNAADRAKHAAIKKDSAIRNKPPPTDTDIDIWNRDTSGDFDDDPPPF